jgi:hypothetical protein
MQLTGAIEQKLEELKGRLAQFATTPGFPESAPEGAALDHLEGLPFPPPALDFLGLFAVSEGGRLVKTYARDAADIEPAAPLLAELVEAARLSGMESARETTSQPAPSRDLAVSRLLYDRGTALFAVAFPVTRKPEAEGAGATRTLVAAGYKRLDAAELRTTRTSTPWTACASSLRPRERVGSGFRSSTGAARPRPIWPGIRSARAMSCGSA